MRTGLTLLAAIGLCLGVSSRTAPAQGPQDSNPGVVGGGLLVRDAPARAPSPAPRNAAGRVVLGGATATDTGVWVPGPGITAVAIKPPEELPLRPWARRLFEQRLVHELEPHARCKASGVARAFQTPYGVEFVELPELQRIYIFDIGGPHTYRTIYTDGRSHPPSPTPSAHGHSIGWWDGDTLVVDTTGFNENFWLDRKGLPHTERLRTLEKWTRTDRDTITYEVTVDDPGAYTAPWTTAVNLRWEAGTELFEFICQQANYAPELMVSEHEILNFTAPTVP